MSAPRVLFVRFSAIGDCVMATWAATAIRQKYPDAFLCWAVESRCAPVIHRLKLASQVYEIPRERWKRSRWSVKTWREQTAIYTRLRRLHFDWGIDLQGHTKTALLMRLASPTTRIAARATDAFANRLTPPVGLRQPPQHNVEWQNQVISTLERFDLPERPIMPDAPPVNPKLVTITVGAGHPSKIYAPEKWKIVASGMVQAGYGVTVLGGPADPPLFVAGTDDQVGKIPLSKSLELVAQSRLHIAADTGLGHAAAAYGTPVLSIFGPTDPEEYRPFSSLGKVLLAPGMKIEPGEVIDAAIRHLEATCGS